MQKGVDKASKCTSISTRTKLGIFVAAAINNSIFIYLYKHYLCGYGYEEELHPDHVKLLGFCLFRWI